MDRTSLLAIHKAWKGAEDDTTRIAKLISGTGAAALNATTVTANGAVYNLAGSAGRDWYFAKLGRDTLSNRTTDESVLGLSKALFEKDKRLDITY